MIDIGGMCRAFPPYYRRSAGGWFAQEIEVAAAVGLQDLAAVEMGATVSVAGRRATRASRKSCPGLRTRNLHRIKRNSIKGVP